MENMDETENSKTKPAGAKYTYTPDEDAQNFGPGMLDISVPGVLRVEGEPAEGQAVEFRVGWIEGKGIRPIGITVLSLNGQEITSTDLRAVRAKDLWREGMARNARYIRITFGGESEDAKDGSSDTFLLPDDKLQLMRLNGPVYSTLSYVVDLYQFADTVGLAPVQYIQQTFAGENLGPLPRTTATKWIKRAKDQGLFEEWFEHGDD